MSRNFGVRSINVCYSDTSLPLLSRVGTFIEKLLWLVLRIVGARRVDVKET